MLKDIAVRFSIVALLSLTSISAFALADEAKRAVNIPAGELSIALDLLARQSRSELMYRPEQVRGFRTQGAQGDLTPREAVTLLLKGTPLEMRIEASGALLVVAPSKVATSKESNPDSTQEQSKEGAGKKSSRDFRVAQVDQTPSGTQGVERRKEEKRPPDVLEEVVVTGSRLKRTTTDGPQPVQIYTRDEIERSGQSTVADYLNTLPAMSQSITENPNQAAGQVTVNLRGLPYGSTLVLLNGRRLETSGFAATLDFFDLNNIPLAAVERIEVVADGASAIYGSDAIAGVVNLVLKKDYQGLEVDARYGGAVGLRETNLSADFGKRWDRGDISIVASYQARSELDTSERTLTSSNDYTRFGGPDNNFPVCHPGNVFSLTGAPLPGAPPGSNATYAAVSEAATSGKPPLSDFNYGQLNTCSLLLGSALIPATHRSGILAQGNYELTRNIQLFTELMYSRVEQSVGEGYPSLFGFPGFQQYTVSASNPFNPFGTDVGVAELLTSVPGELDDVTDFYRLLIGAKGALGEHWDWEIAAWTSADRTTVDERNIITDSAGIQNALNSANPATALNPFVAGSPGALLQSFFSDGQLKSWGRSDSMSAFIRGPAFNLPAGPVNTVFGAEYDRDTLSSDLINDGIDPPGTREFFQRRSYALFGEARIPVISDQTQDRPWDILAVTLAGRHEHYDTFGSKTVPQAGLEWRPLRSLLVRGTYAQSFKAPSLHNLYSPETIDPNGLVTDPSTGLPTVVSVVSGGNPNLKPMNGESHTLGVVYSSEAPTPVQLAATFWSIREDEVIQSAVSSQLIVDNQDAFPGRVIRAPDGEITEVIDTAINFGTIRVSGIDYHASLALNTPSGRWTPSLNVSQTLQYTEALVPGATPLNGLSQAQDTGDWAPRWKGTAAVAWEFGPLEASIDARYVGRYQDYDTDRLIGNLWFSDLSLRYDLNKLLPRTFGARHGTYIELGGVNIFNRLPQYSNFVQGFVGYDPAQADIRGRFLYAGLSLKFW